MKTQKFTSALFILLFVSLIIRAEHVEPKDAANTGKNYYWENCHKTQVLNYDQLSMNLSSTRTQDENPLYYVFNINKADGFIIVSADNNTHPVLGYSTSGSFTGKNLPPALEQMLNRFATQINEVITQNLEGGSEIEASWEKYQKIVPAAPESKAVSPLLVTTWNQNQFYNQQCPTDASGPGGHVYAGCVAVSMAQVMHYHQHPAKGIGSNSYVHPTYGTISANFGATSYNYSSMPVNLTAANFQVAQFMFHCGVSVNMNYSPGGSAPGGTYWDTDIENALKNNFDYASGLQWKWKNNFNYTTWITMLKSELDLSRPIIYYGWDGANNAHNFNCDGYDNNNNFHFNWGWGGYYNGYFPVSNLNPAVGYNYTYYQGAILGMYPNPTTPQGSYDWGDAPDNPGFPTLLANNGARHAMGDVLSLFLGTLIDAEADGQPHINCKGDDNNNLSDEDGVIFPSLAVGGTASLTVNAFGSGLLSAWIDYNQNNNWSDAGEQVFTDIALNHGTNTLTVNIPTTASIGYNYMRFRYSTQANLSFTGPAPDGEVEDYFVWIDEQVPGSDKNLIFSVDIGSDTEMSDPAMDMDEVFDPGDGYLFQGSYMPVPGTDGYIDDVKAFGSDPFPDGGTPGTGAMCLTGFPIEQVKNDYFDMDGIDLSLCDLRDFSFGEGMPPTEKFEDAFIHEADSLYISFDDDDALPYTSLTGSIPRFGCSPAGMVYGQQQNQDEIFELDINLSYPLQAQIVSLTPKYDEISIHPNLTPDPDVTTGDDPNLHDDDVDALDAPANLDDAAHTYFSADHEACYVDMNGIPLDPANIYLAEGGMAHEVINGQMDIGLFEGTDIDAFEFTWAIEPQFNYLSLAMIFSVDDDDPTTPLDESGGMNPNELYLTFMTGWWIDLTQEGLEDDIDAITIFKTAGSAQPPKADFTPLNSILYTGTPLQFTDASSNAPTSWTWTFSGGNPSSHNGPVPPLVIYANPGMHQVSLTVSNANGSDTKTGMVKAMPSDWKYNNSMVSHIISVPLSANPTINGVPLSNNDLIGVFYTDNNGLEKCGGHAVWDGINNLSVTAYGDDITTSAKDGFANGENFVWKVYDWSTFTSHQVSVSYDQSLPNFDGKYYDYGISALTGLNTFLTQTLTILQGWSGISSNLIPTNPLLDTMLAPIMSDLVILKNFGGIYWPGAGVNTLHNWNTHDGYVVKVSQDASLNIQGTCVTNRSLNLTAGWNLVPVLCSGNNSTTSVFGLPEVLLVKEVAGGKVFWPSQSINTLHTIVPGASYYAYLTSNATLTFPTKSANLETQIVTSPNNNFSPWETVNPTPHSHIISIPATLAQQFNEGDVIGAFNNTGINTGFVTLTENTAALTVYGDDVTTQEVDGMLENEIMVFKLYDSQTGKETILNPDFNTDLPNSDQNFVINGLSEMNLKTGLDKLSDLKSIQVYPNPATDFIHVSRSDNSGSELHLTLVDVMGNQVIERTLNDASTAVIDIRELSQGCYILHLWNAKETTSHKIVIRK